MATSTAPRTTITEDVYLKVKERLKYESIKDIVEAGICSYSTGARISASRSFSEYRDKLRMANAPEAQKARYYFKQRKNKQLTNPFSGNNSHTLQPKTTTMAINENPRGDGPVNVVQQGTPVVEKIDTTSGSNINDDTLYSAEETDRRTSVMPADALRMYNANLNAYKHGVNAYKFVDENQLTPGSRLPRRFSATQKYDLCSMARAGATHADLGKYLRDCGYGYRSLSRIMYTMAFDEEGLAQFQEAYMAGARERTANSVIARRRAYIETKVEDAHKMRYGTDEEKAEVKRKYKLPKKYSQKKTEVKSEPKQEPVVLPPVEKVETRTYTVVETAEKPVSKFDKKVKGVGRLFPIMFYLALGSQAVRLYDKLANGSEMSWLSTFIPTIVFGVVIVLLLAVIGVIALTNKED